MKKELIVGSLLAILVVPTIFEAVSLSSDDAKLKAHSELAIKQAETKDCYSMCPTHYNLGE
ncbi:MAG: hypothetical protein ACRCWG_14865 [Sarcina sp.]